MKKRIAISLLLCLCMMLSVLPTAAFAAKSKKEKPEPVYNLPDPMIGRGMNNPIISIANDKIRLKILPNLRAEQKILSNFCLSFNDSLNSCSAPASVPKPDASKTMEKIFQA